MQIVLAWPDLGMFGGGRQRGAKGDMDGFTVSTAAIIKASAGFTDIQSWASNIYRGLIGSCSTLGGMAGDDSAGLDFAGKYDKAADAVINGFGRAVAQLGGTANGLYDTAMTYINAEEDIVSRLHQPYELPSASNPGCEQSTNTVQVPTAAGHGNWVVSHLISHFWPQGDPGRLKQAAEDWQRAAKLISDVAGYGQDETIKVTASCQGSAIDAFQGNWIRTQQALTAISNAATQISSACSVYATAIDQLRAKLEHLAEGAAVVGGVALGLTIVTVGISDATGAAGEGVIAADAAAAAAAMTAEMSASAEVAVLAEAADVVDQAASAMIPVAETSAAFSGGAATATLASYTAPARMPGVGPIPPSPASDFKDLSPARQAQFRQWMQLMQDSGRTDLITMPAASKPNVAARRAYQLRVAGNREYALYTTVRDPGTGRQLSMQADGVRAQDGAAIEAKWITKPQQPGCKSPYTLGNVYGRPDFIYENSTAEAEFEMVKYQSALTDPRNAVNHVEIDTNDSLAGAYFDSIRRTFQVRGETRIVP